VYSSLEFHVVFISNYSRHKSIVTKLIRVHITLHSDNFPLLTCCVVPCQYGMTRPRVMDKGDGFQKVAMNILNKHSQTADKG
jgi:hypothetical protein